MWLRWILCSGAHSAAKGVRTAVSGAKLLQVLNRIQFFGGYRTVALGPTSYPFTTWLMVSSRPTAKCATSNLSLPFWEGLVSLFKVNPTQSNLRFDQLNVTFGDLTSATHSIS